MFLLILFLKEWATFSFSLRVAQSSNLLDITLVARQLRTHAPKKRNWPKVFFFFYFFHCSPPFALLRDILLPNSERKYLKEITACLLSSPWKKNSLHSRSKRKSYTESIRTGESFLNSRNFILFSPHTLHCGIVFYNLVIS